MILFASLVALALAFLPGCGGGGGGGGGGGSNNNQQNQLSNITGTLKSSVTGQALSGITVTISGTNLSNVSDGSGNFAISNVPVGQQTLDFSDALGNQEATDPLAIAGANDSLGTITLNIEGNPPTQPGL